MKMSLRSGCPVDTSAKQKHRPSRQARPPQGAWQSVSLLKGEADSFALCAQNDITFVIAKVRVSGGHLCKAEAPTEPAGETQSDCGNPFLPFKIIKFSCARAARAPACCT